MEAETYAALAYKVYQDVFESLAIKSAKKIIIIPDGPLNYLPFEALITDPSNSNSFAKQQYLIKQHIVNYQYSATIFAKLLQQSNQPKHNKVLSVAPVSFKAINDSLPHSREEVHTVAKLFPSHLLTDGLAIKDSILQNISNYNILHFSTHANSGNQASKQRAHVMFHDDNLWLDEVYQQKINANLTVLSACETNLGKYEGGEGVMSISRAFAYAGCPSLVSTLWQVKDQQTKDIIVQFYKYLKKGKAKDEALRQAKLDYLRNENNLNNKGNTEPFYWASIVVLGNTNALNIKKQLPFYNYLWLLIPLGVGVYFLFRSANEKNPILF